MIQNTELNLFIGSKATAKVSQAYCDKLVARLAKEHFVFFEMTNSFFVSEYDNGILVYSPNKVNS